MAKEFIDLTKYEKLIKVFTDGQTIFREGEPGKEMYIIARGEVEISKKTDEGEKVLMTIKAGDIFGEMALIDNFPRSASAVSRGQSTVLMIDEKAFDGMVLHNPRFALKVIKILAHRLRNANFQIYELITKDRENQLLSGLISFSKENGEKTFKGMRIVTSSFIKWVKNTLGYSEKTTRYLLRELMKKGTIESSAASQQEVLVPDRILNRFKQR